MRELAYTIEKKESLKCDALTIAIHEVEKQSSGTLVWNGTHRNLYQDVLQRLATGAEQSLITLLVQHEMRFSRDQGLRTSTETAPYNKIHIPWAQSVDVLKRLAITGKLYFNNKRLVCDFFGDYALEYVATQTPDGGLAIAGMITSPKESWDIRECDFTGQGPPHWVIKGICLRVLKGGLHWKWIQQVSQEAPLLYTPAKVQQLIDTLEDNDDSSAPKLKMATPYQEVIAKAPEPFPILKLHDRYGAFATLWMDYGSERTLDFQGPENTAPKSTRAPYCKRQLEAEKIWESDLLSTDFISKVVGSSNYYCPVDKVAKSLTFLLEVGWKILDSTGQQVVHYTNTSLELSSQNEHVLVKGKVHYGEHNASVVDVVGAFNRRESFISLGQGRVGLLSSDWIEKELSGLLEGEIVSDSVAIKKNHLGTLGELFKSPKTVALDKEVLALRQQLQNFEGLTEALPGKEFCGHLRPYQQQGVNWIHFLWEYHFHGILADDMGLGKTVQVLGFLSRLPANTLSIVVVPTSLLFNWKQEVERFLPGHPIYIHHGPQRARTAQQLPQSGLILTSYGALRLDQSVLSQISFQCIFLDEAQIIKNPDTQIAQAVYRLKGGLRLIITGTPVENHMEELWSHFRFLMPDLLGSREEFRSHMEASAVDSRHLQKIKKQIRPFLLRRRKEDVAKDLPEKIEQTVWVEMEAPQRHIYESFLAGIRSNLLQKVSQDGVSKHRMEVFEAILRLRQICCHPLLVDQITDQEAEPSSAKFEQLLEDLATVVEEGRKVLVYSQFTSMLKLIAKAVKKNGWKHSYLDGSTTNREQVVNVFQEDPSISIFLISLKAGGVGLNLTAADYVFLYDPWWNEAVEAQAIGRAHRIGRKETVIAKRYLTIESIEEKIMRLKSVKQALITGLLDGEGQVESLTAADLQFLLS